MMAAVSAAMMSRRLPTRPNMRMTRKARIDLGQPKNSGQGNVNGKGQMQMDCARCPLVGVK